MFLRHPVLSIATLAYLGIVAWLTLSPQVPGHQQNLIWQLALFFDAHESTEWITFNLLEFAANVALFVPLGIFFVLLLGRGRWWLAILLGVAMTVAIEFGQQFVPNRISDPRDLLANSIGTVVGTLLALVLTASKARRLRQARGLAASSS